MKRITFRQYILGSLILGSSLYITFIYQNCAPSGGSGAYSSSSGGTLDCVRDSGNPACQPFINFTANGSPFETTASFGSTILYDWNSGNLQSIDGGFRTVDGLSDNCIYTKTDGTAQPWIPGQIFANQHQTVSPKIDTACMKGHSYLITIRGIGYNGQQVGATVRVDISN